MSLVEGWTEKRFWSFLRSLLRRGFQKWPNKWQALSNAKLRRGVYQCASCKLEFKNKEVAVDHIEPCGSLSQPEDVWPFVERLFCGLEGLQVLCTSCHKLKTLRERGMSDVDIKVAEFSKNMAADQRAILSSLGMWPERNEALRKKQYEEYIRSRD